jgi:hypothetical protein
MWKSFTPHIQVTCTSQAMCMVNVNGLNFGSWTCFKFITFTWLRFEKRYHLSPYNIFLIDDIINYIEMAKIS